MKSPALEGAREPATGMDGPAVVVMSRKRRGPLGRIPASPCADGIEPAGTGRSRACRGHSIEDVADSRPEAGGTSGRKDDRGNRRPGLFMGRLFGIPVYVSPTWFIVAVVITWIFEAPASQVVDRPASY